LKTSDKKVNSAELVYRRLREMIDTLELFPGTRITEVEIAKKLAVSRTPIREALQRLQLEGQVEVVPKQGCFVRNINIDLINQFYDVRITLESHTVELACDNMPQTLLENLLEEWSPDKVSDDYNKHIKTIRQQEEQFHCALARGAGNDVLGRYLDDVNNNIRVVRWLGFPDMDAIRDTYEEHYELCEIIRDGKKRSAKSVMKKHIQKSQALSKKVTLQQLTEYQQQHQQNVQQH